MRAARLQQYRQEGIFSSLEEKDATGRLLCYLTCFMCCIPFCSDPSNGGGVGNRLDKFRSAIAARVPRSWGEVCFLFSFNGFLLNRHRLIITIAAITGACAALVSSYTDSADKHHVQDTNASRGLVYAFLDKHCDQMPKGYYDGAHFDFWTIWLLISLYCGASVTFIVGTAFFQTVRRCCKASSQSGLCLC